MQKVGQTTAKETISTLEQIFAIEGLPDTIFTDNGTQFISQEFQRFCIQHQIKHLISSAFHPASNGEAERFVQTFKNGLNKNSEEGRDLIGAIRVVLASYRTSSHPCLNWRTPAEVLHGRQPKCLLSLFLSQEKQSSCLKFQNDSTKAQFNSKFDVGSLFRGICAKLCSRT